MEIHNNNRQLITPDHYTEYTERSENRAEIQLQYRTYGKCNIDSEGIWCNILSDEPNYKLLREVWEIDQNNVKLCTFVAMF